MTSNNKLENQLNATLQGGNKVWVIGDVHGHNLTLQELLSQIELGKEDRVIFVGDLIDSGPRSAQVIEAVRSDSRFHSIRGNHEQMMIDSVMDLNSGRPGMTTTTWLMNGGMNTMDSFDRAYGEDSDEKLREVCQWFTSLPLEIILDRHRIVHAGYDPLVEMDSQKEDAMLWFRERFFDHPEVLDAKKQIIFGHTPTQKIAHLGGKEGEVLISPLKMSDGRSSWIALDTGIKKMNGRLSAYGLHDSSVISVPRMDLLKQ
jgi:serine/threonine protein phosphatase 1